MKNFTYKSLIKYLFCACLFYFANSISAGVPFSLSLFPAFCSVGFSPVFVAIIFCFTTLLSFSLNASVYLCFSALFLGAIYCAYKIKKAKVKGELFFYLCVALLAYFSPQFSGNIYTKLAYSAIIYAFAIVFILAMKVIFISRFKRKVAPREQISFYLFIIILSLGAINVLGVDFYEFLTLTVMLFLCRFYKSPKAFIPAFILPIAITLYLGSFTTLALFEIYCAVIVVFLNYSVLASAIALIITELAVCYFSGEIFAFTITDYLYTFLPAIIYLFIPSKLINALKNFVLRFEEPEITREIINAERGLLSLKLNDLASVFCNMEKNLNMFDGMLLSKEKLKEKIADEVIVNICTTCAFHADCVRKSHPKRKDLTKLILIGISKGKVSLIDLSKDFSSYCYSVNSMIYEINRLISLYVEQTELSEQTKEYKKLISLQAGALADILNNLAYDYSKKIEFNREKEKEIFDALTEKGILPRQIVCAGEDYHILFGKEKIIFSEVAKSLSLTADAQMSLNSKSDVGCGILAVFKKCPLLDASFGVAQICKEGASISGDCHTLTKIDEGRFIVALCDGMGSGENAYKNSQTAIELFEAFYKSGLPRQSVLELANRILSVCAEDSFSTLDCAVFDLNAGACDVIKIGASYGFLVTERGVKIIENTSLPLGVLEEVSPNVCALSIKDGDMIVILSDGITDAFFSSTDTVDFLEKEVTLNPQTLADKLLNYALEQYGGVAKDDMTAIVVKVYSK